MDHQLKVLVRLDLSPTSSHLIVTGCLTETGCAELLPIIKRTHGLTGGLHVTVDLRDADHIDDSALTLLKSLPANDGGSTLPVDILPPQRLPVCDGLQNAEPAFERRAS